jgi:hypothetical protein
MKIFRPLAFVMFAQLAVIASYALPPTSISDSFLSFTYGGTATSTGAGLFYFGTDGTCQQLTLSTTLIGAGGVPQTTYETFRTGTYAYVPGDGVTTEPVVTLTMSGAGAETGDTFAFFFSSDTDGILDFARYGQDGFEYAIGGSFTLLLNSQNNYLANVSNRVTLRPADTAISGFVIQGTGSRLVLIRTVGPTLALFGVSPVSQNPQLNLFLGTGSDKIGSGQPWGSVTGFDDAAISWIFGKAGAFGLETGSTDVVYFGVLSPAAYTALSSDTTAPANGASALTEVYILPYSG